ESASPMRIEVGLTTTGAGNGISLRQSGDLSISLGVRPDFKLGFYNQLPPLPTNLMVGILVAADLTSAGEISISQSGSLAYFLGWDNYLNANGHWTGLGYASSNLFGIRNQTSNLLASGGAVTLSAATQLLSWTGNLTGSGGVAVTAATAVLRGTLTANQGSIALAIADATLSGTLEVSGGGSTISLTGRSLWLADAVTSRGGAVAITLSGEYSNLVKNEQGLLDPTVNGRVWTTTNQNMSLSPGAIATGRETLVNVGTSQLSTNTAGIKFFTPFSSNVYVTNAAGITDNATLRAALTAAAATDGTAEYVSLDQISQGKEFNDVFTAKTGSVSFGRFRDFVSDSAKVTFWNLTRGEINRPLTASSFVFAGTSNSFTHGLILKTAGTVTVSSLLEVRGGEFNVTAAGNISFSKSLTGSGKVDKVRAADGATALDSGLRLYSDGTVSFSDTVALENGDLYLWAKTAVTMAAGKSLTTNGGNVFFGHSIPTVTDLNMNLALTGGTAADSGKFFFSAFSAGDTSMGTVVLPTIPGSYPTGLTFAGGTPVKQRAVVATGILTVSGYSSTVTDSLWLEGKGLVLSGTNSFAGEVYLVASGAPTNIGTAAAPILVAATVSGTTTVTNNQSLNFITLLHLDNGVRNDKDLYEVAGGKLVVRGAILTAAQINLGVDSHARSLGSLLIDGSTANVFNGAVSVKTVGWGYMTAWDHQLRPDNRT
ncbi:MAG: hypothetical protein ORO03_06555, partial [Alphaproteobacteria bacterium]|nr:hypothetical protein [Alphaproteobacteria bacterium]